MSKSKKIVMKVDITGDRCKAGAMSVVAKLPGIKSMAVDGEKGTLTVVGEVDVVCVANALSKAKFAVEVVSVGPEKEEKKPDQPKKPEEAKPKPPHHCCPAAAAGGCCSCGRFGPVPPFAGNVVCYEERPDDYGCVIL